MDTEFSSKELNEALDYLEHHGITGMKWGKRNGPPYPLDASQKSSAEKSAEKGSGSGSGGSGVSQKKPKKVSPKKAKQMKEEEYEALSDEEKKAKIMNEADTEMLVKYSNLFDDKELQSTYNRALLLSKSKDLVDKDVKRETDKNKDKKTIGKKVVTGMAATTGALTTADKLAKMLGYGDGVASNAAGKATQFILGKTVDKAFMNLVFDVYGWADKRAVSAEAMDLALRMMRDTHLATSTAVRVI